MIIQSHYLSFKFSVFLSFILVLLCIQNTAVAQSKSLYLPSKINTSKLKMIKEGPLKKAGTQLAELYDEFQQYKISNTAATFISQTSLVKTENEKVVVDVISSEDPLVLEQELNGMGMEITGIAGPVISGLLPIDSIDDVALLEGVNFLRQSMVGTNVGLTTSQGDAAMHTDNVRTSMGIDGSGVTVGVLSDSYDVSTSTSIHAADDVTSGDLPGTTNPNGYTTPVNVIDDETSGTDEGRAMLQIIHDVAPGAKLAFATAFGGQASFANNITSLRTTGNADIIVDDVFYYFEPMFQDGIIAQAVNDAYNAGVPYFSSAGNQGKKSYESEWRSGPAVDLGSGFTYQSTFDFDPGPGVDNLQSFTLGSGQTILIILNWDSPFASVCPGCPGAQNDIDILLLNASATTLLAGSYTTNIDGDAVEGFQYTNYSASTVTYNLLIGNYEGTDPGFIKYINFGNTQGNLEYATNSSTVSGHCNATGAMAVAAAPYNGTPAFGVTPPVLESYSSWGPTAIRFDTNGNATFEARSEKPEITAPDGVNTTFFYNNDIESDGYPNFFGTSAAAPHAAAVAALMLEANSSLTPAQIYSNMKTGTIDMLTPGFDNGSGYGLINAEDISPLPVELTTFSASINGKSVMLNWNTATEVNNYGFVVERKFEMGDWNKIVFIEGHGTSNSPKDYNFVDNSMAASGKYSYRLKQIDIDGKFEYSDKVEVSFEAPSKFALNQNYPNPFNPTTSISYSLSEDGFITLNVYDVLGRQILSLENGYKKAGNYVTQFDASKLSSGMYIYTIKAGNFTETKKMLLMK